MSRILSHSVTAWNNYFLHFNSYLCKGKEGTHATMLQRMALEEDVIFCLLPVGVCIDAYVTIRSYVLCVSTH